MSTAKRYTFSVDFTTGSDLSAQNIHTVLSATVIVASDSLIDLNSIQVQGLQFPYDPEEWSMIDNRICGDRSEL